MFKFHPGLPTVDLGTALVPSFGGLKFSMERRPLKFIEQDPCVEFVHLEPANDSIHTRLPAS